jgi:hypothetical protein
MTTSLKVILAATAMAMLASPVMAQSQILPFAGDPIPQAAPPAASISSTHRWVSHPHASRVTHEPVSAHGAH